jgi:hypothetical protein
LPPVSEQFSRLPQWPHPDSQESPTKGLRKLHRLAEERFANTPAYLARLTRREQVRGTHRAEEQILFKYRKEPLSIYMRWLGDEAKDREVLFVKGRFDELLHILPANGDRSGLKAIGKRPLLLPDAADGVGGERYPVKETGLGPLIDRFGQLIDALEFGGKDVGTVKYMGLVKRPEFESVLETVVHLIPEGVDSQMPQGGQRFWHFDPNLRFPVLVIAQDALGREAEYYCFDRFLFPTRIADEEFDPAILGRR